VALPPARLSGYRGAIAGILAWLGHFAVDLGDYALARARFGEAVVMQRDLGYAIGMTGLLNGLGNLAAAEGRHERALRLAGAAERLTEESGVPAARERELPQVRARWAARQASSRVALGEKAAEAARVAGRALSLDEAIAEGLAEDEHSAAETTTPPETVAGSLSPLSEREAEVAELILAGHTNRAIGAELFISERTVERHVANILNKLGLASRAQIAAWVVERRVRAGT
jgi:non-specific serine/threonine protein kinase